MFGAALMLLAAAPDLPILGVLMFLLGFPLSPWLGCLNAAVQRATPSATNAEGFTWLFAVITVGMASGNALGGALIQSMGPTLAFLVAGATALAGVGVGLARHPAPRLAEARRASTA